MTADEMFRQAREQTTNLVPLDCLMWVVAGELCVHLEEIKTAIRELTEAVKEKP